MLDEITIAHLNVRSLISSFNEFNDVVMSNKFDLVGVTETWLTEDLNSNLVNIRGYTFFRCDRLSRGGGVGAYVKCPPNTLIFHSPLSL